MFDFLYPTEIGRLRLPRHPIRGTWNFVSSPKHHQKVAQIVPRFKDFYNQVSWVIIRSYILNIDMVIIYHIFLSKGRIRNRIQFFFFIEYVN